ncbi:GyrI-like domain-containing protein [Bacillus sp. Marseille-Q1617]|uniref:GyrI-like domain-containing protein n=1 Tax=Bacillus sp. Marseille-Q1617 TaxID=2736887 RepID=UPI00158CF138|nr:effector binding domain-containing protein [Bacillus sp. Marseille-Q1617]
MECKKVNKHIRLVGMKGKGTFDSFGTEVPKAAQQFLARADEIKHRSGTEVAIFEPKKDENHLEGSYYVGMIVDQPLTDVPSGMEFIELSGEYVMTRGNMDQIGSLHHNLVKWADENGYTHELDSYIVETYHPLENGGEEVEIYLPVLAYT